MRTPLRNVRVPGYRWQAALAKARAEGTNLSAVINGWLANYTEEEPSNEHDNED